MFDSEHLTLLLYCMLSAAWGGGVKFLRMVKKRKRQSLVVLFIYQIVTSSFVGCIFYVICLTQGISPLHTLTICAVAGSFGDKALSELWNRIALLKGKPH